MRWDPGQYQRFAGERSRPFVELLARVGAVDPRFVVDLGCGAGDLTASLLERWPNAVVEGVDSSPEMMAEARPRAVDGRLSFHLGDAREWRPDRPVDVLVANAALQWVARHSDLMPAWVESLAPGGWFAFMVPGNQSASSHALLAELAGSERWRNRLHEVRPQWRLEPDAYLELLSGLGCDVDAWETTYYHVLSGPNPVLEWMKGTGLRPALAALGEPERDEFLAEYGERLRRAYPPRDFGTVLPFRRIFVVARRPDR